MRFIGDLFKRYFLSGALAVVPLVITWIALRFLFQSIDGVLSPAIERLFGRPIPGLGVVAMLGVILLAGFLARNYIGSRLFRFWESALSRAPLIRVFYSGAKQLVEGVALPKTRAFSDVVLVEFPRKGIYSVGFVTSRPSVDMPAGSQNMVAVFIPATPTPVTGSVALFRHDEILWLDLPVEQAVKFMVSGGIVSPGVFPTRSGPRSQGGKEPTQP